VRTPLVPLVSLTLLPVSESMYPRVMISFTTLSSIRERD